MYESGADEMPNPNAPLPSIEDPSYMRNVIGLASDFKARRYFFSDIQRGDIQSVLFDGSNFTVIIESKELVVVEMISSSNVLIYLVINLQISIEYGV